jgi:hypothetical protein
MPADQLLLVKPPSIIKEARVQISNLSKMLALSNESL